MKPIIALAAQQDKCHRPNAIYHYCVRRYVPQRTATLDIVEATFDFIESIVRLVSLDDVASTLLLLWTGLNKKVSKVNSVLQFSINCALHRYGKMDDNLSK